MVPRAMPLGATTSSMAKDRPARMAARKGAGVLRTKYISRSQLPTDEQAEISHCHVLSNIAANMKSIRALNASSYEHPRYSDACARQ